MAAIKAFQAVYYNPEKIKNFNEVMCPPYDVISKEQQDEYYKTSPYNFIRLELPKESSKDNARENRYTRAHKTFEDWLSKGVLVKDDTPAIYYYKQEYKIRGQKHSRLGFISLMKMGDDAGVKIYPHENTHASAKTDRLTLWKSLKAALSCIFVCFSDKQKKVETIFVKEVSTKKPLIDVVDHDKVRHMLWRMDNPEHIATIENVLDGQQLFIADGHHRFEVAQEYRRQQMKSRTRITGNEPFNYVMTYFTNMESPDLQIFPMHRIVKQFPTQLDFLEEYFRIDKIKNKEDLLILLAKAGQNEHAFGLYDRTGIRLLRLKNKSLIDKLVQGSTKEYRNLDASILKSLVFDRVGVASEDILYTKDMEHATSMVDEKMADAAFIMNAVQIKQLRAIALTGERMPPKTTYFYPKVLSGLTIHKMG
ncbi:MAG: DUF1015 domain-containing protein [Candidatus Omnitrophica bacterium]|nr:DUF1015 domain-containing protein [Candidatus Omnitrophota bacterium]